MRSMWIATVLMLAACGKSGEQAYGSYQACFDDHTMVESLPFQEAVVVCCTDHAIDGHKLACGADASACVTYLGANLTSSATAADVMAACTEYEIQKGM